MSGYYIIVILPSTWLSCNPMVLHPADVVCFDNVVCRLPGPGVPKSGKIHQMQSIPPSPCVGLNISKVQWRVLTGCCFNVALSCQPPVLWGGKEECKPQ